MTGTRAQLYNGIMLLFTFFTSRLVFGTYQSYLVLSDFWRGVGGTPSLALRHLPWMAYSNDSTTVPLWAFLAYFASNMTLNFLNFYWFFKMVSAVRKRFEPTSEPVTEVEVDLSSMASGLSAGKQPTRRKA